MAQGHKVGPYYFQNGRMFVILCEAPNADAANAAMTGTAGGLLDIMDDGTHIIAAMGDKGIEAPNLDRDSDRIEFATQAKLNELGLQFVAHYVGQMKRDDWDCDAWRVTFKAAEGEPRPKRDEFTTDYYTGLGHRKSKFPEMSMMHRLKPVAPKAADVLHSLCLDAQAENASFGDWCSDFGYSSDSIAALNIYQACEKIGRSMRAFFGNKVVAELASIVQEY